MKYSVISLSEQSLCLDGKTFFRYPLNIEDRWIGCLNSMIYFLLSLADM